MKSRFPFSLVWSRSIKHSQLLIVPCVFGSIVASTFSGALENGDFDETGQVYPPLLVNSILNHRDEFALTFMPDGKTLFYSRASQDYRQSDIYVSTWENGVWSGPQKTAFSGPSADFDPFIAPGAEELFFVSNRCPVSPGASKETFDLWVMKREGKQWGSPKHLGPEVNGPYNDGFLSIAKNGNLYFCSDRPEGHGSYDIYRAVRTTVGFLPAENLGAVINADNLDTDPLIAPDERFLIYSRAGNLHISYRLDDSWGDPQDLGPQVNTPMGYEYAPGVTPDGRHFYFTRQDADGRRTHFVSLEALGIPWPRPSESPQVTSGSRESFSLGPWEEELGYRQALRVGNLLFISGTVGVGAMEDAVADVYATLQKTLAHFGLGFSDVAMERVYTTDIEALKAANSQRLAYYQGVHPAATWVQVSRLFSPEHVIEVELIAVISKGS